MEGLQNVLNDFLKAFSRLDLEGMMVFFEDDATSFFPSSHHIVMLDGKEEIKDAFEKVISKIHAAGHRSIKLDPEDVKTQLFGDTAIVTFHIRDNDLSRRTLVLRRNADGWFIQHLHASNAPLGETQ